MIEASCVHVVCRLVSHCCEKHMHSYATPSDIEPAIQHGAALQALRG
jgi:hypothetical protein